MVQVCRNEYSPSSGAGKEESDKNDADHIILEKCELDVLENRFLA